jgi:putative hemolysin
MKMTGRLNTRKFGLLFVGICIEAILAIAPNVSGQGVYSGSYTPIPSASGSSASTPSTSSSDRAHCVGSGYLYKTTPDLNGGQPVCQFDDYNWCDANAFATGKCSIGANGFYNPYGIYYPYTYNYPIRPTPGGANDACFSRGGNVRSVHTPYGDVDMCVLPDGSMIDLYGLYNGYLGDEWEYFAYSFLNAP